MYDVYALLWGAVRNAVWSVVCWSGKGWCVLVYVFDWCGWTRWDEFEGEAVEGGHAVEEEGAFGCHEPVGGSGIGEDAMVGTFGVLYDVGTRLHLVHSSIFLEVEGVGM